MTLYYARQWRDAVFSSFLEAFVLRVLRAAFTLRSRAASERPHRDRSGHDTFAPNPTMLSSFLGRPHDGLHGPPIPRTQSL